MVKCFLMWLSSQNILYINNSLILYLLFYMSQLEHFIFHKYLNALVITKLSNL